MGVPELEEYKFGFHDDVEPVFSTGEGLTEEVIREMSRIKGEPEWMLEFRLKSLETFNKMPMQTWGPDLQTSISMPSNITKNQVTNPLVTGKTYQKKSKIHLKRLVYQKLNELI